MVAKVRAITEAIFGIPHGSFPRNSSETSRRDSGTAIPSSEGLKVTGAGDVERRTRNRDELSASLRFAAL